MSERAWDVHPRRMDLRLISKRDAKQLVQVGGSMLMGLHMHKEIEEIHKTGSRQPAIAVNAGVGILEKENQH